MATARKKMSYNEKEPKDLVAVLKEKEEKLLQTDIAVVQGKLKNVHEKRKILKEIARIKTALRSKEVRN
ncbi:MAG: 50S ribosomal protein L29 [Candidatus Woykebacteria bacterium RBG_19FT_COMBO_43_10]|uniref:Large ribosomal subunit protein uL29 n=1 Tax=Candidatus Woykebacteria bacterium RBG_19FT_COMBO_43_10 TaxID=1802598 RepID=A0A1G1WHE1_9BACT|nr:MAG: 50S ribosomal protein L29 [Candidatus Woykebacteria bacterium RBG_19FT_COMBO_43_10]